MIQGGAVHVLPPTLLSVAILIFVHAIRFGGQKDITRRFFGALVIGCSLSASKLAAGIALVGNLPRDQYPLPGISSLEMVVWRAFQTLFVGPPDHPEAAAAHSMWVLQRHEWEYGVSTVPLLLMLAWVLKSAARFRRPLRFELWLRLALLLAVPIALNWYEPSWNSTLKTLPLIGSSSNLLRWFAAYILPACVGGALALDAVTPGRQRTAAAAVCVVLVVAGNALTDRSFYGPQGQGVYQIGPIEQAWRAARNAQTGPRITAIRVLINQEGRIVLTANRGDGLAYGYSQLLCYEALFGYNLERFPVGALHAGPALESSSGMLNVKNPACYVFPEANSCSPGDPFPATRIAAAEAFLNYEPFPFKQPLWARVAGWLSIFTASALGFTGAAFLASAARRKVCRHSACLKTLCCHATDRKKSLAHGLSPRSVYSCTTSMMHSSPKATTSSIQSGMTPSLSSAED
jgi:hypothetical protein